ncbi:hypothetical protein TNCV_4508181 [Trichonephila clavipes]|nr:hypothetical protein TNCV_4508181 [Trichonephila clavipes]
MVEGYDWRCRSHVKGNPHNVVRSNTCGNAQTAPKWWMRDYLASIARVYPPPEKDDPQDLHAEIVEVEIEVVSPSIVPLGNFAELNRTVTCMVLKTNRRTSCSCYDEFRGPRSDYVRQVALENNYNLSHEMYRKKF